MKILGGHLYIFLKILRHKILAWSPKVVHCLVPDLKCLLLSETYMFRVRLYICQIYKIIISEIDISAFATIKSNIKLFMVDCLSRNHEGLINPKNV
jgi:hypothetical protein